MNERNTYSHFEDKPVLISKAGSEGNVIKFQLKKTGTSEQLIKSVMIAFNKFEKKANFFIFDLVYLKELTVSLVVLLFEITARLRRRNGDLFIINLNRHALEDLLTFNPKTYLSTAESEHDIYTKINRNKIYNNTIPSMDALEKVPFKEPDKPQQPVATKSIEIPYQEEALYKACDFVTFQAQQLGFTGKETSRIKIAVYEACLNAIEHSRHSNPDAKIRIDVERNIEFLKIVVYDHGQGFQVENTRDYDVTEAASHRKTGGMGLHIIRKAMDNVSYKIDHINGNKLVMIKYLIQQ